MVDVWWYSSSATNSKIFQAGPYVPTFSFWLMLIWKVLLDSTKLKQQMNDICYYSEYGWW